MGNAASNIDIQGDNLYASVCLQSINEEVQATFGNSSFVFDLEGFKQDMALTEFNEISKVKFQRHQLLELVKSHLIHYSYVETL